MQSRYTFVASPGLSEPKKVPTNQATFSSFSRPLADAQKETHSEVFQPGHIRPRNKGILLRRRGFLSLETVPFLLESLARNKSRRKAQPAEYESERLIPPKRIVATTRFLNPKEPRGFDC